MEKSRYRNRFGGIKAEYKIRPKRRRLEHGCEAPRVPLAEVNGQRIINEMLDFEQRGRRHEVCIQYYSDCGNDEEIALPKVDCKNLWPPSRD